MRLRALFTFILIFISSTIKLHATHATGGEIAYKCLGGNQFEILFKFYRDCSGIGAPNPLLLDITNNCLFPDTSILLTPTPGSPIQIAPLCANALSTCNGGLYTGIEEWVYSAIVTLPGACDHWTFSHSEASRNSSLTTISGAGSDALFVYATMNNVNGVCHDSPYFINKPIPFACTNQHLCYNNGVYKQIGDSLTYQLITPRTGPNASDTVSYINGFSMQQPLLSSPPMSFDTTTGEICMFPTDDDVTPIAILVNQYMNGVLVGQVERDMQFTVTVCTNYLPVQTWINGTPGINTICPNYQYCMVISAADSDTANTTTLSWDHTIPGVIETHSGGSRDTMLLCWTPTNADTINNPHCITVMSKDDNCPFEGVTISTYCLEVDSTPVCSTVSVRIPEKKYSLKIYPQPATNKLTIDLGNEEVFRNGSFQIVDAFGKAVYTSLIPNSLFSININLPSGIYFTDVKNKNNDINLKKLILIIM